MFPRRSNTFHLLGMTHDVHLMAPGIVLSRANSYIAVAGKGVASLDAGATLGLLPRGLPRLCCRMPSRDAEDSAPPLNEFCTA